MLQGLFYIGIRLYNDLNETFVDVDLDFNKTVGEPTVKWTPKYRIPEGQHIIGYDIGDCSDTCKGFFHWKFLIGTIGKPGIVEKIYPGFEPFIVTTFPAMLNEPGL